MNYNMSGFPVFHYLPQFAHLLSTELADELYILLIYSHISLEYKYLKARAFIFFIHCFNSRIQDQSRKSQTTHWIHNPEEQQYYIPQMRCYTIDQNHTGCTGKAQKLNKETFLFFSFCL